MLAIKHILYSYIMGIYLLAKDFFDYYILHKKLNIRYMEYHIAEHCNLNCKACGHLSNITKPEFPDLKGYIRDINRLSDLLENIDKIRLMGGEPLLNPELGQFIIETKKAFPNTDLRIVSNGLLVPKISEELIQIIKDNDVTFDITQYPPTEKMINEIKSFFNKYNIKNEISEKVNYFVVSQRKTAQNGILKHKIYKHCNSRYCHFLTDGKMAVCAKPFVFSKNGIEYSHFTEDTVDIYDKKINSYKLKRILNKPINGCLSCEVDNMVQIKWEGGYKEKYLYIDDYINCDTPESEYRLAKVFSRIK